MRNTTGGSKELERLKDYVISCFKSLGYNEMTKSRKREIVFARQACMAAILDVFEITYVDVGYIFGGYDHTTVRHAKKSISDAIQTKDKISYILSSMYYTFHEKITRYKEEAESIMLIEQDDAFSKFSDTYYAEKVKSDGLLAEIKEQYKKIERLKASLDERERELSALRNSVSDMEARDSFLDRFTSLSVGERREFVRLYELRKKGEEVLAY